MPAGRPTPPPRRSRRGHIEAPRARGPGRRRVRGLRADRGAATLKRTGSVPDTARRPRISASLEARSHLSECSEDGTYYGALSPRRSRGGDIEASRGCPAGSCSPPGFRADRGAATSKPVLLIPVRPQVVVSRRGSRHGHIEAITSITASATGRWSPRDRGAATLKPPGVLVEPIVIGVRCPRRSSRGHIEARARSSPYSPCGWGLRADRGAATLKL